MTINGTEPKAPRIRVEAVPVEDEVVVQIPADVLSGEGVDGSAFTLEFRGNGVWRFVRAENFAEREAIDLARKSRLPE